MEVKYTFRLMTKNHLLRVHFVAYSFFESVKYNQRENFIS